MDEVGTNHLLADLIQSTLKQIYHNETSVITLTLLHPTKTIPLQHWTFKDESIIRIGRGIDNNVVLYSVVVSRHHLEIRNNGSDWELESFGANGTFIDGQLIKEPLAVNDGMVIRLASSGPKIQIRIKSEDPSSNPSLTQTPSREEAPNPTESSREEIASQDLQPAKD